MSELIKDKISRWSLERVQFLLAHIENFVDDADAGVRERARSFVAHGGLEHIEQLVTRDPGDPQVPLLVLENLAPFFEAGLLLQRGAEAETPNWWVTDLFWRGNVFHLEMKDQVRANNLIPEITPLQVHRAPADKILASAGMSFLRLPPETEGYLLRPTPSIAYVLLSRLAAPWAVDHVACAHKLVNKCFLY